jgi:hypothetical protein
MAFLATHAELGNMLKASSIPLERRVGTTLQSKLFAV